MRLIFFITLFSVILYAQDNLQDKDISTLIDECEKDNLQSCVTLGDREFLGGDYIGAIKLYEKACDGGVGEGCSGAAHTYKHHIKNLSKEKEMYLKAIPLYEAKCEALSAKYCTAAADTYKNIDKTKYFNKIKELYEKSISLYDKGCSDNISKDCESAGLILKYNNTFVKNGEARSKEMYKKAIAIKQKECDSGNAEICKDIAYTYASYIDSKDINKLKSLYHKATSIYEKKCDGGDAESCSSAAILYEYTDSIKDLNKVKIMYAKEANLLEKSCDAGDMDSCDRLSFIYRHGIQDLNKEVKLAEKLCNKNVINECSSAARLYMKEKIKNIDKAIKYYEKSCNMDIITDCLELAKLYKDKENTKYLSGMLYEKVVKVYENKCSDDNIESCAKAGNLYDSIDEIKDTQKAKELYQKVIQHNENKCEKGDRDSCLSIAALYYFGFSNNIKVTMDFDKSLKYFEKGCPAIDEICSAGIVASRLREIADKYYYGEDNAEKDLHKAFVLYKRACEIDIESCFGMALMYQTGYPTNASGQECAKDDVCVGIKKDYSKAMPIFQNLCSALKSNWYDIYMVSACDNLGVIYAERKEYHKAKEYFEKTCNFKGEASKIGNHIFDDTFLEHSIANSCGNLGVLYANGWGVKLNIQKALQLQTKACASKADHFCKNLGFVYFEGKLVPKNITKAKEYFGKACDLGNQEGCNLYKKASGY